MHVELFGPCNGINSRIPGIDSQLESVCGWILRLGGKTPIDALGSDFVGTSVLNVWLQTEP
jgi:hypothetical protein